MRPSYSMKRTTFWDRVRKQTNVSYRKKEKHRIKLKPLCSISGAASGYLRSVMKSVARSWDCAGGSAWIVETDASCILSHGFAWQQCCTQTEPLQLPMMSRKCARYVLVTREMWRHWGCAVCMTLNTQIIVQMVFPVEIRGMNISYNSLFDNYSWYNEIILCIILLIQDSN